MNTISKIAVTILTLGTLAPVAFAKQGADDANSSSGGRSGTVRASDDSATVAPTGLDDSRRGEGERSRGGDDSSASSSARLDDDDSDDDEDIDDDSATTTDKGSRERRRSQVAAQVQALLRLADRDSGIGEEVRAIAREHASSSERVDEATTEVEERPGWMIVLIGADYKNLGALRSEMVTTRNQIERLVKARDRASEEVQSDLDVQIEALRTQASTTDDFIRNNEDSFSLFGWLFRIFNR